MSTPRLALPRLAIAVMTKGRPRPVGCLTYGMPAHPLFQNQVACRYIE
jgi:hypothetical protein